MVETRNYEFCYILKPETSKELTDDVQARILSIVKENDGKIETIDEWPVRKLVFPIKKETRGRFTFVQIRGQSAIVPPIQKYLTFNESVLRHDVFVYPAGYDYHAAKKSMRVEDAPHSDFQPRDESEYKAE